MSLIWLQKGIIATGTAILLCQAAMCWVSQLQDPSPFKIGVGESARQNFLGRKARISNYFPFVNAVLPNDVNTIAGTLISYFCFFLNIHHYITFWSLFLFNLFFILFMQSNLNSFLKFLTNIPEVQNSSVDLYEEYLEVKSLVDLINHYCSTQLFSLVITVVPYFTNFLSSFSDMPTSVSQMFMNIYWAIMVSSVLFFAAETCTKVHEYSTPFS